MSIREIPQKIKGFLANERLFQVSVLLLVVLAAFGLGRLSVQEHRNHPPIQKIVPRTSSGLEASSVRAQATSTPETKEEQGGEGRYVGSKNSDRYHLPWCSGAQRIADANKVWFASKEEAEAQGYKPAGNCKGM